MSKFMVGDVVSIPAYFFSSHLRAIETDVIGLVTEIDKGGPYPIKVLCKFEGRDMDFVFKESEPALVRRGAVSDEDIKKLL